MNEITPMSDITLISDITPMSDINDKDKLNKYRMELGKKVFRLKSSLYSELQYSTLLVRDISTLEKEVRDTLSNGDISEGNKESLLVLLREINGGFAVDSSLSKGEIKKEIKLLQDEKLWLENELIMVKKDNSQFHVKFLELVRKFEEILGKLNKD